MSKARSFGLAVLQLGAWPQVRRPQVAQARWTQATAGYVFAFPRDHASHPDYKIEWWYYTGNVKAADGRRFGYQVTFFRVGIDHAPANPSKWAVRDLYMTHLAVSDAKGSAIAMRKSCRAAARASRARRRDRYHVWNDDWTAGAQGSGIGDQATRAARQEPQAGIDLVLDEGKPPAINGIDGISQKGARPGNASHYYSLTRMPTKGTHRRSTASASRSPARAGWITSSAPAFSSPSSAAGTGCRSSSRTTAS